MSKLQIYELITRTEITCEIVTFSYEFITCQNVTFSYEFITYRKVTLEVVGGVTVKERTSKEQGSRFKAEKFFSLVYGHSTQYLYPSSISNFVFVHQ